MGGFTSSVHSGIIPYDSIYMNKKAKTSHALIIVESPTKARTISQFIDSSFHVESSFGHVRDLPKNKLGINTDSNFEPTYIIPLKSRKNVTALKKLASKASSIILATDEDREGEAIAWHLTEALGLDIHSPSVKRIVFHEITRSAIIEALEHPRTIHMDLVYAQQARRILDRIVGYLLSPFLWKKVLRGLSAGRVQSVALRLIVDREDDVRSFKPQEYWTIDALLKGKEGEAEFSLISENGTAFPKPGIPSQNEAERITADLKRARYTITEIIRKESRRHPLPPFTTSTLQQEASKRLGYSSKKTMMLAQRLYEKGFITYMRTDSVHLSKESIQLVRAFIPAMFGETYQLDKPRAFTTTSRLAQEAHEAIRPTQPSLQAKDVDGEAAEQKLYDLVWRRFVASQMPAAIFQTQAISVDAHETDDHHYQLKANGSTLSFDGFLKVWPMKYEERTLPNFYDRESLVFIEARPTQHFTEPPPRYNEASLIKDLEKYGIGRPSTYAPIISVILARNYVLKNEARRFEPTDIGELVSKLLKEHFPEVVDIQFTAKLEEELDAVAQNEKDWQLVIREFYEPFSTHLQKKNEEVEKISLSPLETTDEVCEKCGKPMAVKRSRFGKFLACTGFPECRSTKSLTPQKDDPLTKNFGNCPECKEGLVLMRRTKKGRMFYGCSRYPDCKYATWKRPVAENDESRISNHGKENETKKEN